MKYAEFQKRQFFNREELLNFGSGKLVADPPGLLPRLPSPPFLMFDRIVSIEHRGARGRIVAEADIRPDLWFFACHFQGDPVQPGCLELDAVWQLMGFYCGVRGALGAGRALGCGTVDFSGQIRPHNVMVRFEVEILRAAQLESSFMCMGSGRVFCDDSEVCSVQGARVGVFRGLEYASGILMQDQVTA